MPLAPIAGEPDPRGADCVACGRCCHHGPQTVHLLVEDEERMRSMPDGEENLRRLTVLMDKPPHMRFIINDGERCGGLDLSVPHQYPCRLYQMRPTDCRIVEPGSPCCMEARRLGHLGNSQHFLRADRTDLADASATRPHAED